MAEALKEMYSPGFYAKFAEILGEYLDGFDRKQFLNKIFDDEWEQRELKSRMRHTTLVLHPYFPAEYSKTMALFYQLLPVLKSAKISRYGFEFMLFPDYIEVFGLDHFDISVRAMEYVTTFASCEFAVRPYLIRYGARMTDQMYQWSTHPHPGVRRLSCEGCRPRLPWAMRVPALNQDPSPILPILENLKDDPEESVRRSVANNINDVSKDHPEFALKLIRSWQGGGPVRDKLLKHGARTLLKKGHPEALGLFGYITPNQVTIEKFCLEKSTVRIGEDQIFSFDVVNAGPKTIHLRLEYAVYFMKANGTQSKKIFKISEKDYPAKSRTKIKRRQHFKVITTRRYHPGKHAIAVIVNGREGKKQEFSVMV